MLPIQKFSAMALLFEGDLEIMGQPLYIYIYIYTHTYINIMHTI